MHTFSHHLLFSCGIQVFKICRKMKQIVWLTQETSSHKGSFISVSDSGHPGIVCQTIIFMPGTRCLSSHKEVATVGVGYPLLVTLPATIYTNRGTKKTNQCQQGFIGGNIRQDFQVRYFLT